jgi:RNase P protein component
MRALARNHLSPLARNGIDYVLIARHDTATANWQDLAKGLQKAIRYLHRTIANGTNSDAKPSAKPMADSQPQNDP